MYKEEEPFKGSCSSSVCGASNLQRIHSACCNMLLPHTYAVHVQLTLMYAPRERDECDSLVAISDF